MLFYLLDFNHEMSYLSLISNSTFRLSKLQLSKFSKILKKKRKKSSP